jgi:hypothetical protein
MVVFDKETGSQSVLIKEYEWMLESIEPHLSYYIDPPLGSIVTLYPSSQALLLALSHT